jgi:hypothetical protein
LNHDLLHPDPLAALRERVLQLEERRKTLADRLAAANEARRPHALGAAAVDGDPAVEAAA